MGAAGEDQRTEDTSGQSGGVERTQSRGHGGQGTKSPREDNDEKVEWTKACLVSEILPELPMETVHRINWFGRERVHPPAAWMKN